MVDIDEMGANLIDDMGFSTYGKSRTKVLSNLNKQGLDEDGYVILRRALGPLAAAKNVTCFHGLSEEVYLDSIRGEMRIGGTPIVFFIPKESLTSEMKEMALKSYDPLDILEVIADITPTGYYILSDSYWEKIIDIERGYSSTFAKYYGGSDKTLIMRYYHHHILKYEHVGNIPPRMLKLIDADIYETIPKAGAKKLFNATDDQVIKTYLKLKFAI